jgi:Domain of unknown function (DUF4380)
MSAAPDAEASLFGLDLDDARLEIDASVGGRVTALRLAGRNLLTAPEVDPVNFGSTFWTSPQVEWGWPPLAAIDTQPYAATLEGEDVVLCGPTSDVLGVAIEKRFAVDRAQGAFVLTYRVVNHRALAARVAPWEVTRVLPNGLTFFATGAGTYAPSDLPAREQDGITWIHHDAAVIRGHQKLYADTSEGWIAHIDDEALFVKTFAVVPRAAQAPGEAQVEIYASSMHRYVEVEAQGAYETIAAGDALVWSVAWRVRRLPAGLSRALGSAALVRHVRALVAGESGSRP